MTTLTGRDEPVKISAGFTLQAPDLLGEVVAVNSAQPTRAADSGLREASLITALANSELHTTLLFELDVTADRATKMPGARGRAGVTATTRQGEAALVLTAEQTHPNQGYAVLYTDEGGVSRWILAEENGTGSTPQRRGRALHFHLPRAGAPQPPPNSTTTRGPITKLGRRVVRMVTWATDEIVGLGARKFAEKWENAKRPSGFVDVRAGQIGGPVDWDVLRGGRALLLLHGTFSLAQSAFDGLVASPAFAALAQHYEQRTFAFNHPSLHVTPTANVQTLLDLLPPGIQLDLDIVTHSRGGLVGRTLTECLATLDQHGCNLQVGKAIFVAAPHRGTILADGDNWLDLVDRYTNLLTNLPDNVYILTIEGVLTLVKLLAHGGLQGLPGLQSMLPNGPFLQQINRSPAHATRYYALAASFTPTDANLLARLGKMAANRFVDAIFGEANDGVVPTAGSYAMDATSHGFPIPENQRKVLELAAQVHHCNYFANETVNRQIVSWLTE